MLFAKQTGTSAALTSGYRMKALIYVMTQLQQHFLM